MTSVEWFANEIIMLEEKLRIEEININDFIDAKDELVNRCLEMEKEQIRDAFNQGMNNSVDYFIPFLKPNDESENYYNKTFKSE